MPEAVVLADGTQNYGAPVIIVRELVLNPGDWLSLRGTEVMPAARELSEGGTIVWSSPWPVSPSDEILIDLAPRPESWPGSSLRFRWATSQPPDARGVGKVRYRLNYIFGGEIRGPMHGWTWTHRDP